MTLVHGDPVRPAGARAQFLNPRQKRRKELRTLVQFESDQIDDRILVRFGKNVEDLRDAWCTLIIAEHDAGVKRRIISFGIDDDELVFLLFESFQKSHSQGGLSGTGTPGDENVLAVWPDPHVRVFVPLSQYEFVMQAILEEAQIRAHHGLAPLSR